MKIRWTDISKAPRTGAPFWLGTGSGGVLMEAWHWCSNRDDYAGVMSQTTLSELRSQAPKETFLYAEIVAPRSGGVQ